MSGIAGRTNYSDWNKKTDSLLSSLDKEEQEGIEESKAALGHDKYANSEAEAKERVKADKVGDMKKKLDGIKKREAGVVQILTSVLNTNTAEDETTAENNNAGGGVLQESKAKNGTRFITRKDIAAGKRVLNITDTNGPGKIILTEDLTSLESIMPPNANNANDTDGTNIKSKLGLIPKSYPGDAENDAAPYISSSGKINGLIKVSLSNLKNCTVAIKCKVITGLLEISHCENVTLVIHKSATVVTIQADLCQNLNVEFHDAPSGKGITATGTGTTMFWGEDKDDRIFHAGVKNLKVKTFLDGFVDLETEADFEKNGAKAVGNAGAEEVQFVTSVLDGELVTEKVLRQGSATGTTVTGGLGGGGSGGARAMTGREMKEVEKRKEQIRKAVGEKLGGIKILDKDGNEVPVVKKSETAGKDDGVGDGDGDGDIEEVYAGMSQSSIDDIVKDCEAQKAKGNEAFVSGEYAQAILLYTLALDRAAELPDASDAGTKRSQKQLFPRHVVLSNRSASFLKLGHHDKALKDGTEADRLEPTYVKGIFRKGLALHAMGNYQEAITALAAAQKIEPKNKQIKQALQFAEVRMHQEMRKRTDR